MATATTNNSTKNVTSSNLISKIISGLTRKIDTSHVDKNVVLSKKKAVKARNSTNAEFNRSFTTRTQYLVRNNLF
ncbi:MAG: hypothetical protein ACXAD7_13105 [Candidatus Kariarchaeaceae archaeon]|jgi:hypothetical protein